MLLYGNGVYMLVFMFNTGSCNVLFLARLRVLFYSYFCLLDDICIFYAYYR
ncbi:hypothetical protein BDC45DRAFT_529008 [Circinella umbellata]|nr:hypothetical protein BDC45DRAFT_529008 [Circinella umbellata]